MKKGKFVFVKSSAKPSNSFHPSSFSRHTGESEQDMKKKAMEGETGVEFKTHLTAKEVSEKERNAKEAKDRIKELEAKKVKLTDEEEFELALMYDELNANRIRPGERPPTVFGDGFTEDRRVAAREEINKLEAKHEHLTPRESRSLDAAYGELGYDQIDVKKWHEASAQWKKEDDEWARKVEMITEMRDGKPHIRIIAKEKLDEKILNFIRKIKGDKVFTKPLAEEIKEYPPEVQKEWKGLLEESEKLQKELDDHVIVLHNRPKKPVGITKGGSSGSDYTEKLESELQSYSESVRTSLEKRFDE